MASTQTGAEASTARSLDDLMRSRILTNPETVLEDAELMKALIANDDQVSGRKVVDLRGRAIDRLEKRLDRLEQTHQTVIAAAYDNLAGTNQIHRAVLRMLDPMDFESFLKDLGGEVAEILRVDHMRLVLETTQVAGNAALDRVKGNLALTYPGYIDIYLAGRRGAPVRPVVLRSVKRASPSIYGETASWIRSEALMKLDLGPGRLPGLLVMGAEDGEKFKATHGTDLLSFFAGAFERAMRRWLA